MKDFTPGLNGIEFARAHMPDNLAVLTLASTAINYDASGIIQEQAGLEIIEVVEEFFKGQTKIAMPLPSEMLPGICPVSIEPVSPKDTESLKKFYRCWKPIGQYLLRMDTIRQRSERIKVRPKTHSFRLNRDLQRSLFNVTDLIPEKIDSPKHA